MSWGIKTATLIEMRKGEIDIITLGCSKNLVDAERLMRQLELAGYRCVHDSAEPKGEIAIINTCGFIGDAKEESIDMILQFAERKTKGKLRKLYVMGCLSQRYREELPTEIPEVDKWFGKFDYLGIVDEIKGKRSRVPHDTSVVGDPDEARGKEAKGEEQLPALWRSLLGPIVTIILLALRPIAGIVIDPMIALPIGGVVGIIATAKWRDTAACLTYGLEKMSGIAILLVGTGTLAGIIKASAIKDVLVGMLAGWSNGGTFMAPIAGALMSAATASTTAGATIASASFGGAILAAGVTAVWGAAMTNAGATTLDHLPHGSFFHATGGSMGFSVSERLRLIPYETLVGLILTLGSIGMYFVLG